MASLVSSRFRNSSIALRISQETGTSARGHRDFLPQVDLLWLEPNSRELLSHVYQCITLWCTRQAPKGGDDSVATKEMLCAEAFPRNASVRVTF